MADVCSLWASNSTLTRLCLLAKVFSRLPLLRPQIWALWTRSQTSQTPSDHSIKAHGSGDSGGMSEEPSGRKPHMPHRRHIPGYCQQRAPQGGQIAGEKGPRGLHGVRGVLYSLKGVSVECRATNVGSVGGPKSPAGKIPRFSWTMPGTPE